MLHTLRAVYGGYIIPSQSNDVKPNPTKFSLSNIYLSFSPHLLAPISHSLSPSANHTIS